MREHVRIMDRDSEFYTDEGCFITELSNSEEDPEASIHARVSDPMSPRAGIVSTESRSDT